MTFFRSFFDESGKFKDHRVISFCGVMASPESLKSFNDAWDVLLRKNGMASLHTAHALKFSRALSPVIPKQSQEDRCEAIKPFVDTILDNVDLGISISVDVRGYSKWDPKAKKRVGGNDDPAYFAFMQATMAVKAHACREDDRISLMCDDDTATAWNFYQLYRQIKKIDNDLRKKFVALSFADDEAYPALQAADLVAGLMRLEALRKFGYHPHSFVPLVSSLLKSRADQKMKWIGLIGDEAKMGKIGKELSAIR